ncbi:HK97 family phage prohead protease [Archangium primigenium]|uniref:HK97 family phage prohead protease n=1 Tax=[Archangium] primigenium TaxID=2792470 RepID=UPI001958A16E|nr:HK97 family phage prohead protease [Archangium primigenium]MBM7117628.1 HK97 family phage prohead protease [Archangium primigenium]
MTRSAAARPAPPEDACFKSLGHLVKKSEGSSGTPVFRISTAVLDRHNDRVPPEAVKTENFEKNPVLLWNHDDRVPAIGTCKVYREGDEWFMEPTFDELDELSKTVAAKVKAGTLRTCSIRFRFKEFEFNAEGGLDYAEVELLEVSIVNIPANPEAYRVKANQQPKPKQKNEAAPEETPVEETSSKGLAPEDLEAIRATVTEAMVPVLEQLAALQSALAGDTAQSEDGEPEEPVDEEEKSEGDDEDDVQLSDEDMEELKNFLAPPTPKAKPRK